MCRVNIVETCICLFAPYWDATYLRFIKTNYLQESHYKIIHACNSEWTTSYGTQQEDLVIEKPLIIGDLNLFWISIGVK